MNQNRNQSWLISSKKCPNQAKISWRNSLSRVAIRYSKALFDLALEKNMINEVRSDLEMIYKICTENPDFKQMLDNPLIEENSKSAILENLFKDKVNAVSYNFLQLLSKKRRSSFLLEMIDKYVDRVLDHEGILPCLLISSHQVESEQAEDIKKRIEEMTGKKVIFSFQIDESLLGGFIVKIKDTVIDLSVKTQLESMRTRLAYG
jgi:F-type H+-transporting ATPase subunit delta